MGSIDLNNSTSQALLAGETFVASTYSSTLNFSEILVTVECDSTFDMSVYFSSDGVNASLTKLETSASALNSLSFYYPPYFRYLRIELNNTGSNQTFLRLNTILKSNTIYDTSVLPPSDVNIVSPLDASGYVQVDVMNNLNVDVSGLHFDASGNLKTIVENLADISGTTVLVGNLADISGTTVLVSNLADISGTTVLVGNLADISGTTVLVSNLADISGTTVLVSNLADISGTTVLVGGLNFDASGNLKVADELQQYDASGNLKVRVTNLADVSGANVNANITNTFLTVKAKPTYSISTDSASNTSQNIRSSGGVVHTIVITSVNTTFPLPSTCDYVKFYNSSSATAADGPLFTVPIRYGERLVFQADMNFSSGLCVRATSLYAVGDTSVPASTIYITSFLTAYSE